MAIQPASGVTQNQNIGSRGGSRDVNSITKLLVPHLKQLFPNKSSEVLNRMAAGIGGNIKAESGGKTSGTGGDGGTSDGIVQWHGTRLEALKKHEDWKKLETQVAFIFEELKTTQKATMTAFQNKGDSATAGDYAEIFCIKFEIPDNKEAKAKERRGLAETIYKNMGNNSSSVAQNQNNSGVFA